MNYLMFYLTITKFTLVEKSISVSIDIDFFES